MPKTYRQTVTSLFSLSVECIVSDLPAYKESLQYLPAYAKEKILRKFLSKYSKCQYSASNEILSVLLHPQLKQINLSSININDDSLNKLKICRELTDINLRNYGNQNITSEGLKMLFQATKNLVILDIAQCESFNDDVLECVSIHCQRLRELCAEGCNLSDYGFIQLGHNNKKMKCVAISNTQISGEAICTSTRNKNCLHLHELRLDNCPKVDDDVLKTIIHHCPKIEILTFYNCAITDQTSIFQDITMTCKNLKQLHWTITW